jgi:glycine cleavage system regulatory protein
MIEGRRIIRDIELLVEAVGFGDGEHIGEFGGASRCVRGRRLVRGFFVHDVVVPDRGGAQPSTASSAEPTGSDAACQTPDMATLVLTVIGDDRTGLVDALAAPIVEHGGNWDRSHMARLAGKFAGIVVVSVPDDRVDGLTSRLGTLTGQGLLDVTVAIAAPDGLPDRDAFLRLQLIGQDRPGIVREVAAALAQRSVSIEELETSSSSAPMSAERLFEARATLRVPAGTDAADVRAALEDIANELMVDLDVTEHRSTDDRSVDRTADEGR